MIHERLFVGTYTRNTDAEGIYVFDTEAGAYTLKAVNKAVDNPSYLILSPNGRQLYCVNEISDFQGQPEGAVSAFDIGQEGGLSLINQLSSRGGDPCHLAIDGAARFLLVSNYTGGSFASIALMPDGALGGYGGFVQHHGSGPDTHRQSYAHVHSASIATADQCCYVADLGLDRLSRYPLSEAGLIDAASASYIQLNPGAGPRHLVFSTGATHAYLINELDNTLTVLERTASGRLAVVQTLSSLPEGYLDFSSAADVHLSADGCFLYASNRGHDSLAVFAVERAKGLLSLVEMVSVAGSHPRNFILTPDDRGLLVANKDSDEIVIFDRDKTSGRLTDTGNRISVPSPVCLQFATTKTSG